MRKNEIWRSYGTDYKDMTKRLLQQADLAGSIPADAARIAIKPNLVVPSPASFGGTTHPEVVAGIIEYLQEAGYRDIVIAEGSWVGDRTSEAFTCCGYRELADIYTRSLPRSPLKAVSAGSPCPDPAGSLLNGDAKSSHLSGNAKGSSLYKVTLLDTQKDKSFTADCSGEKLHICSCVKDWDFLINVPVLKGHCQTHITCALKNLKGLLPNSEKRRFHTMGLHRPIAHLNSYIRQDFIVVDHICGDLDFEEGGHPVTRNCVMAAADPVLVDAFVCSLLHRQVEEVPYILMAEALGVGSADLSGLRLITCEGESYEDLPDDHRLLDVSYAVDESDSCSACYGTLIPALERLKEEGLLDRLEGTISIGQGHRGHAGRLGVGNCTSGFDFCIKGCPPTEEEIYEGLRTFICGGRL